MELDELKSLWQATDERLDAMERTLRLNAQRAHADRTRSRLWRVSLVLWYEVAAATLALLLLGSYLHAHFAQWRFALPAALLHVSAVVLLGAAVRQLVALRQIEYDGPVVAVQRRLAELQVTRARANRWVLLSSPLLWALLVVVVPHGLLGFDVYLAFGPAWVLANLAFGVAALGGAIWVGRRAPAGSRLAGWLRALGRDATGDRVAAACRDLEDVAAFEREAEA